MLQIKKVLSLPDPLLPNTMYLVEDGTADGLKIVVTGVEGTIVRSTSSKTELLQLVEAYVETRLVEVIATIPVVWTSVLYDHGSTWGSDIYILQMSGTNWRVRKIAANGTVTHSRKTDPSNSGYIDTTAWDNRTTLVYS